MAGFIAANLFACNRTPEAILMASISDLVSIMHQIDSIKGRCCGECQFYQAPPQGGWLTCQKGYGPAGFDDGCDDWKQREAQEAA